MATASMPGASRNSFMALAQSVFFFSSRRRHTRCSRDWSSDVCSSDIAAILQAVVAKLWKLRRENLTLRVYPADFIEENKFSRRSFHNLRSEEHTSELQSRLQLVCRLLLGKKKQSICYYCRVHD